MPSISYSSSWRRRCHSAWYSITSSIESRRRRFLLTRNPIDSSVLRTSHCDFAGPAGSSVYMNVCRSRLAVTVGSIWRTLPAAVLRGLTNRGLPAASISRFKRSKPAIGKYTSPRTSKTSGNPLAGVTASGTLRIVRRLAVTSSPTVPSPRVAARCSRPFA